MDESFECFEVFFHSQELKSTKSCAISDVRGQNNVKFNLEKQTVYGAEITVSEKERERMKLTL